MARINITVPEPTPQYTTENQRQIAQSLQTLKDQLNTTFQEELKQELDRYTWFVN
tara:strand:- start:1308 stop:1472 length:165 start_codon:yes stop_codon:yes gene_type:complete